MAQTLVLYFASETRALYRWRRNRLELEKRFAPGEQGLTEFRQALARCPRALLHVVVDLAGEDFHEEQVPVLRGSERRIVIERRLAQRYRDARFSAAISLGPASDERRNERLLLASLPQSGSLAEWLDAAVEASITLASVVSAGLVAPALAAKLKLRQERLFFASVNSAGLRQSFIERGRLRFSRLEPIPAEGISPAFVRSELGRTLAFLESSHALSGARPLYDVVLIVSDGDQKSFEDTLANEERLVFRTLGIAQATKALGVRDSHADSLYLRMAVRRPPKEQFLRGTERRPLLAWRLRRAMAAVGASAFAACAAYASVLWFERVGVRAETVSVREQVARLRAEEQRQRTQVPVPPADADSVKAAALAFRRVVSRTALPEAALVHVSQALDQAPDIELDALSWEMADSAGQALEIRGRVHSAPRSDYREIGGRVERFSKLLASADWRVAATRMPFDAAPQAPLAGDFTASDASERARFSILLARTTR